MRLNPNQENKLHQLPWQATQMQPACAAKRRTFSFLINNFHTLCCLAPRDLRIWNYTETTLITWLISEKMGAEGKFPGARGSVRNADEELKPQSVKKVDSCSYLRNIFSSIADFHLSLAVALPPLTKDLLQAYACDSSAMLIWCEQTRKLYHSPWLCFSSVLIRYQYYILWVLFIFCWSVLDSIRLNLVVLFPVAAVNYSHMVCHPVKL